MIRDYLDKNLGATIKDAAISGVFPYVMTFRDFFEEHYIEEQITGNAVVTSKMVNHKVLYYLKNYEIATFKLSDTYCYDHELYGMQSSSGSSSVTFIFHD